MAEPDPALFYTGLVADLYRPLRSADFDAAPFAQFIEMFGEPALELGCGDGDPLLDLRVRGLDVDGLDASADMLERCRARAAADGIDVTLHEARIEDMDLGRRYRSIFLAGATYNLLPDDEAAQRGLRRIAAHLEPGGAALVPLFIPEPPAAEHLGRPREHDPGDGTLMRCTTVSATVEEDRRLLRSVLRYELDRDGTTEVLDREWLLHWHTQDGFRSLAEGAGLEVVAVLDLDGRPADADAVAFTFLLGLPDRPD